MGLWGFGFGALATVMPPTVLLRQPLVSVVVAGCLSWLAMLKENPLIAHAPIILCMVYGAISNIKSAQGQGILVGVVLMAAGEEVAKLPQLREFGLAELDVLHVFLAVGQFMLALSVSAFPLHDASNSTKKQR